MRQEKINTMENPIEKEDQTKIFTLEEAEKIRADGDEMRKKLLEELKLTEGEEKGKEKCNEICAEEHDKVFGASTMEKSDASQHIFHYVLCAETIRRYKKHADKFIYDNMDRMVMVALLEKSMEVKAMRLRKLKR